MSTINTKHKDRLFGFIYGREENKEWTLSLYNAINNSSYDDPSEIEIETIDDVLFMGKKNDVAFLISDTINLYEHQSTLNPNMPIRQLMYLAKLYEKYIDKNGYNKYNSKRIHLPIPKLLVFYNGKTELEDSTILRLSDSFDKTRTDVTPDVEVTVQMLNINLGKNKALMESCESLKEYSWFVDKTREYAKIFGKDNSVNMAINEMQDTALLKPFLTAHRAEVMDMFLTGYDEEEHMNTIRAEGREEGINIITSLYNQLIKDQRLDDLKRANTDHEFLTSLLKEYNMS